MRHHLQRHVITTFLHADLRGAPTMVIELLTDHMMILHNSLLARECLVVDLLEVLRRLRVHVLLIGLIVGLVI